jgi:RNA polymerase sigma-70 factor, ECF subfamily
MLLTPELVLQVKRAQDGDIEAFTSLMERFEPEIRNYLFVRLGDYEEASDVTQQVFLKAWQHIGSLHDKMCFKHWLFSIVKRLVCDYWRSKKLHCQSWEDLMLDSRLAAMPGPEESTEKADLIHLSLIRLSFKQRQCLVLHIEGFSPCEIAALADVSLASVGTYVSMARKKFRAIYQELESESGAKEPVCV